MQQDHRRRSAVVRSTNSTQRQVYDNTAPIIKGQEMVVYNLAHIERFPRSQQASIRLLGFVNNIEKANELVSELGLCDKIDCFMKKTSEWIIISSSSSATSQEDDESIKKNLALDVQRELRHRQQTEDAARHRLPSKNKNFKNAWLSKSPDEDITPEIASNISVLEFDYRTVKRTVTCKPKKFAVVSVLKDLSHKHEPMSQQEPMVRCFGQFATKEKATAYINTIVKHIDFDIFVVEQFQWLHPQIITRDPRKDVYRDPVLQEVMNMRTAREQKVTEIEQNNVA